MRVILFTGKGGVGKTTAAAATAVRAARVGRKTLAISTDAAHSLADALDLPLGGEPSEVDANLFAAQVDAQRRFEESWDTLQRYLVSVLDAAGMDPISASELTVLPGAEEVLALLEVRAQAASGRWDVLVVDCAPTAETLRLLALPEALDWYMRRIFPVERRVVRSLRPVLGRVAGVPMPTDSVFDAMQRLHEDLGAVRGVLLDPATTSARLVLTPEAVVVAEARRTYTSLTLFGYQVDGVVANRLFPSDGADPWRARWVAAQAAQMDVVQASFAPLPVWRAPYAEREPVGLEQLAAFADAVYGSSTQAVVAPPAGGLASAGRAASDGAVGGGAVADGAVIGDEASVPPDPLDLPSGPPPVSVERDEGTFTLLVRLPLVERGDVDLARNGDELVLTVAAHRRILTLPSALRRCTVTGALLRDGVLRVGFAPDPALWMNP